MLGIDLDRQGELPVKRQLCEALKERMLSGRLKAGEALPSTRELAQALSVSRNTVNEAYAMLLAEGFILSRQGAPTVVADHLFLERSRQAPPTGAKPPRRCAADFRTGSPDLALFPRYAWLRLLRRAAEDMPLEAYGYSGPQGLPELRAEIAAWLFHSRGLWVHPEDIFITAGATHALSLAADVLKKDGASILAEDPCHTGMLKVFRNKGYAVFPVPVDESGMRAEALPPCTNAAVLYVTPSHQFPLGGILPAARRTALIRYAREKDLYILEDDYDSEFRYLGEPIAPLYALDPQRVLYTGTFSKALFPAVRIGFALVPRLLQKQWRALRTYTDVQNPPFEQAALALFLRTRSMDRHVRAMRKVYALRRRTLLNALRAAFGNGFRPLGDEAGLHMAIQFAGKRFGRDFQLFCREQGLYVTPVESHCMEKGRHQDMLLLGYGHLTPEQIQTAVPILTRAVGTWADTGGDGAF